MSDTRSESNADLVSRSNQSEASRMFIVAIVVCVVIAVVALIIAAVAISKPAQSNVTVQGQSSGSAASSMLQTQPATYFVAPSLLSINSGCQTSCKKRIYTLAVGPGSGGVEYYDDNGFKVGFFHDVIDAVCLEAGLDCRTVTEPYGNCMTSESGQPQRGGRGLMSGWYDACTGWLSSRARKQFFSFSAPFLKPPKAYFFALPGFNPSNITGKKIGLVSGWFTDERCIAGLSGLAGRNVPDDNFIHAPTASALLNLITSRTVDAGFVTESVMTPIIPGTNVQKFPSDPIFCTNSGEMAMMTRKDNDFNTKWNEGFSKLVASGRYRRLCNDAQTKHGQRGEINCVDS